MDHLSAKHISVLANNLFDQYLHKAYKAPDIKKPEAIKIKPFYNRTIIIKEDNKICMRRKPKTGKVVLF
ncbi:MAG: hypothetical protein ACJAXS_003413 [Colwellia sp.]|jgi:hypothetical protein